MLLGLLMVHHLHELHHLLVVEKRARCCRSRSQPHPPGEAQPPRPRSSSLVSLLHPRSAGRPEMGSRGGIPAGLDAVAAVPPGGVGVLAGGCSWVRAPDLGSVEEAGAQQSSHTQHRAGGFQAANCSEHARTSAGRPETDSFPGQLCLPWVLEAPWRQSHDFLRTRSSAPGAWLHREPGCVRTGTVPAPHRLCQPHTSCLDVLPVAAVFSFLALWGGSGPAQHPWCSSCLHPSPSGCLGLVTARGGEQRV